MRGQRFQAEPLPNSWLHPVDFREVADLCAGSRLTAIQAEVVRLTITGCTHAEIGIALGIAAYTARGIAAQAEWRIRRSQSWITRAITEDLKALLAAHRNTFHPKPPTPIYRRSWGAPGGYDTVRLRSRPLLADDLTLEEGRLLRSLPHLLEQKAKEPAAP